MSAIDWSKKTIPQLRKELTSRGLSAEGPKGELVARLSLVGSQVPLTPSTQAPVPPTSATSAKKRSRKNDPNEEPVISKDQEDAIKGDVEEPPQKKARSAADLDSPSTGPANSKFALLPIPPAGEAFYCDGELLWGQAHLILEGAQSVKKDGLDKKKKSSSSKMSADYYHKTDALEGSWRLHRLYIEIYDEDNDGRVMTRKVHGGWVVTHEDIDPSSLTRQVQGLANPYAMISVNRYTWAYHVGDAKALREKLNLPPLDENPIEDSEDENFGNVPTDVATHLTASRLILVNSSNGNDLFSAFERNGIPDGGLSHSLNVGDRKVGIHVTCAAKGSEEAWLFFEKKKLVGFIYDSSDGAIQGALEFGHEDGVWIENECVKEVTQPEDNAEEEDY